MMSVPHSLSSITSHFQGSRASESAGFGYRRGLVIFRPATRRLKLQFPPKTSFFALDIRFSMFARPGDTRASGYAADE